MRLKLIGAVRLITAIGILGSIYWQVSDRIIHNTFHPEEYWVFFTIDTSLLTAVILIAGTFVAWFKENKGAHWFELGRVSVVAAYVVVAVVYNALLRNDPPDQRDVAVGYTWPTPPNEILHVWAPLIAVIELILVTPALRIKVAEALWAAVYPIVWLIGTIIRGNINHWWPYWFINPDEGGVPSMLGYISGITGILILTAMLLIGLRTLIARFRNQPVVN